MNEIYMLTVKYLTGVIVFACIMGIIIAKIYKIKD